MYNIVQQNRRSLDGEHHGSFDLHVKFWSIPTLRCETHTYDHMLYVCLSWTDQLIM